MIWFKDTQMVVHLHTECFPIQPWTLGHLDQMLGLLSLGQLRFLDLQGNINLPLLIWFLKVNQKGFIFFIKDSRIRIYLFFKDLPFFRSLIDFHGLDDGTVPRLYENSYGEGPLGVVRTIKSADALYYYYKPEYLEFVADEVSGLFTKSHTVIFR